MLLEGNQQIYYAIRVLHCGLGKTFLGKNSSSSCTAFGKTMGSCFSREDGGQGLQGLGIGLTGTLEEVAKGFLNTVAEWRRSYLHLIEYHRSYVVFGLMCFVSLTSWGGGQVF